MHQSSGKLLVGILVFKQARKLMWQAGPLGQIKQLNNLEMGLWNLCKRLHRYLQRTGFSLMTTCSFPDTDKFNFFFSSKADQLNGQNVRSSSGSWVQNTCYYHKKEQSLLRNVLHRTNYLLALLVPNSDSTLVLYWQNLAYISFSFRNEVWPS